MEQRNAELAKQYLEGELKKHVNGLLKELGQSEESANYDAFMKYIDIGKYIDLLVMGVKKAIGACPDEEKMIRDFKAFIEGRHQLICGLFAKFGPSECPITPEVTEKLKNFLYDVSTTVARGQVPESHVKYFPSTYESFLMQIK